MYTLCGVPIELTFRANPEMKGPRVNAQVIRNAHIAGGLMARRPAVMDKRSAIVGRKRLKRRGTMVTSWNLRIATERQVLE